MLDKAFARWRDAAFWQQAMRRLAAREPPHGLPRFGYVLATGGDVVGVLLLIASELKAGCETIRRCNVSSWYVEPAYRVYGSLLAAKALGHPGVTYMNVTPAPQTWDLLRAQGYRQFASGRAVAVPLLARGAGPAAVRTVGPEMLPDSDLPQHEISLLLDHARWDCLSLICETRQGRVPFVFGLRRRRGFKFAYLLYCRSLDTLVAQARPLGLHLARRGIGFVVADGDARLPGMPGWFEPGFPKFFRGGQTPPPGDLAYTERAIFGV